MVVSGRMVVVGREATVVELIVVTGLLAGFAVVVVMVVVVVVLYILGGAVKAPTASRRRPFTDLYKIKKS